MSAERVAISRAGAIVMAEVPHDEVYEWVRMVGRAEKLSDIEQPWRDRIAEVMPTLRYNPYTPPR